MIFIGNFAHRLKKITRPTIWVFLMVISSLATVTMAIDRELASAEVQKLEANLKKDPLNAASAKFLIKHYHDKAQWKDLVRVGMPVQKDLDATFCGYLADAHINLKDDKSALAIIGHMEGKWKPSPQSKLLESQVYSFLSAKETRDEKRRVMYADKALAVLREGVDLNPLDEDMYLAWVDLLKSHWQYWALDAVNVIKVMEDKLGDYQTHNPLKCEVFVKAELWDQGLVACQRAIKANPRDVLTQLNLAEVKGIKVSPEERKKLIQNICKEFPDHYEAQKKLAATYFAENDFAAAALQYKKVVAIKSDDVESVLRLADSEFRSKQFTEALINYKKHCKSARTVASEFKEATKVLRSQQSLHKQYYEAMQSCR